MSDLDQPSKTPLVDLLRSIPLLGSGHRMSAGALAHEAAAKIDALEAEVKDHESGLSLRHEADMRGIKKWQEDHPGNDLTWPSHDDLVVYLLHESEMTAELLRLISQLKQLLAERKL